MIAALDSGKPVVMTAPIQDKPRPRSGPRVTQEDIDRWNEASRRSAKQEKTNKEMQRSLEQVDKVREDLHEVEIKITSFVAQTEFLKT